MTILEFSRFDCRNDVFWTQTKLFVCRFVTERRPFLDPNGTVVCGSHRGCFPSMPQGIPWYFAHDHSIVMLARCQGVPACGQTPSGMAWQGEGPCVCSVRHLTER